MTTLPRPLRLTLYTILVLLPVLCITSQALALERVEEAYARVQKEFHAALAVRQTDQKLNALREVARHIEQVIQNDTGKKIVDRCTYLLAQCRHHRYDATHRREDLDSAVDAYRNVVRSYPESPLADDAQYLIGILFEHENPSAAYKEFRMVGTLFPSGDMRSKADEKAALLATRLGMKPGGSVEIHSTSSMGAQKTITTDSVPPVQATPASGARNRLEELRNWAVEDYTRIVLYLKREPVFEQSASAVDPKNDVPGRVSVTISNCGVNPKIGPHLAVRDALLRQILISRENPNRLKIVFESASMENYRVFSMADPYRIVVDIRGKKSPAPQTAEAPSPIPQPVRETAKMAGATRNSVPSLARQLALDVGRIVIDPGHGGKDKGATSPHGVHEKDVVLAIAKEVKRILESRTSCEVVLTRDRDRYLTLEERTAVANAKKADLFVSIHTNANADRNLHGVETYYLNLSNDRESARVAAFENATSAKKISDLEAILHDLMLNTKLSESSQLAKEVQSHIVACIKPGCPDIRDLGIKQAPFYVLLGAEMPSILIETAFITNDREERRLIDKSFQEQLAEAIAGGIESYIRKMHGMTGTGGKP